MLNPRSASLHLQSPPNSPLCHHLCPRSRAGARNLWHAAANFHMADGQINSNNNNNNLKSRKCRNKMPQKHPLTIYAYMWSWPPNESEVKNWWTFCVRRPVMSWSVVGVAHSHDNQAGKQMPPAAVAANRWSKWPDNYRSVTPCRVWSIGYWYAASDFNHASDHSIRQAGRWGWGWPGSSIHLLSLRLCWRCRDDVVWFA